MTFALYAVILVFCVIGAGILSGRPVPRLPKSTMRRIRSKEDLT